MLCVYDKFTQQDNFDNCGLGILKPSKMTTYEEENGDYSLRIEYPMTESDTMWKHLSPYNVVRNSEGQLFFIHTCGSSFSGGKSTWSAEASHISYFLADKIVEDCKSTTGTDCHDALNMIWNHTKRWWGDGPVSGNAEYSFTFSSNMRNKNWHYIDYNAINPLSAILGTENSVVSLYGGRIIRNNFHISVDEYPQNPSKAFDIKHGLNMLEIRERQCCKDFTTSTWGNDNYGNYIALIDPNPGRLSPHEIIKRISFSYSDTSDNNYQRLRNDVGAYAESHKDLEVSYEVKFKDLRNIDKYKEWMALQSYKIGDVGRIESERLGIGVDARIISRTINDITGETESISLGNFNPSLWKDDRFGVKSNDRRLRALERLQLSKMFKWED